MIDKIYTSIYKAIDEVNIQLSKNEQLSKDPDTILYGDSSVLDSLGLINIIVAVEQNIADDFEKIIILADERAMSQNESPFKTVKSLVEYIQVIMDD
jgi:acyl carrier protein